MSLPDFLIVGEAKCGTSSLFYNMCKHPLIREFRKELEYYDTHKYHERYGKKWYERMFESDEVLIKGEATPNYLFYQHAPFRIKEDIPDVKIIAILRDPVKRAYSHWKWQLTRFEYLWFPMAVDFEDERLEGEYEKELNDPTYWSYLLYHFAYKGRGRYVETLKRYYELFPRDQIKVILTDDIKNNPKKTYNEIFEFLDIPECDIDTTVENESQLQNLPDRDGMIAKKKDDLYEYFRPWNEKLEKLIGRDLSIWNKTGS